MSPIRLVLASALSGLIACSAFAQTDAKPRTPPASATVYIPITPFPLVRQCFDLDPEAKARIALVESEFYDERSARMREAETQVNDAYIQKSLDALDEKSRETFQKVIDASRAYQRALAKARADFDKTWVETVGGAPLRWTPSGPQVLVNQVSGLTQEQRSEINKLGFAIFTPYQKFVEEEAEKQGVVAPADRADHAAFQAYTLRLQEIRNRIMDELQKKFAAEARQLMPEELRPKFDAMLAVVNAHASAQQKAYNDLHDALAAVLPPEKVSVLKTSGILNQPGMTPPREPAPKK